ncbi:MAG: methionine--tRNA ligase [Bacteroidales bacterium]|nr:methionine--tRNA ligase [Bacteroidales bacterium]
MNKNEKFARTLVTCALPYANGPVHIGHLAGVYVPADIYVRYLRMRGEDVLFICGSDEHGVPITIKARAEGCTPQDIVDRYHKIIKDSFVGLGINFDIYSRTSSEIHAQTSSDFFRKLWEEGKFITQESEQYYDPEAKTFLADRYITGKCPRCGHEGAYGDQCEHCGSTLSPEELIDPHSKLSGATPIKKKTSHWYLPLNDYEQWLNCWILDGHKEWRSTVYGQCKSWLVGGLQPRAVSRDLDWGVPVPVPGAEGKVLYVWFDAPIGYISNTKELLPYSWEKWWKADDTRLVHFIGKDNIVFHCIVFPSMLKAHGGYILPDNVPANEFLNLEGDKISTSRNWAVWAHEYLQDFPGKADVMRYVLTANAPETKDNDFSWKEFQTRNNSELVAIFGNFVNRAIVLTHKYFEGKVPPRGTLTEADRAVLAEVPEIRRSLEENLEGFRFRDALKDAMALARLGNKYISDSEPWKTAKEDMGRTGTILNVCLQLCADLAIAFEPFTPAAAEKLRGMLKLSLNAGFDHRKGEAETVNTFKPNEAVALHTVDAGSDPQETHATLGTVRGGTMSAANGGAERSETVDEGRLPAATLCWEMLGAEEILPEGWEIAPAELLFEKIEDAAIDTQLQRLSRIKAENEAAAKAQLAKQVEPQKAPVSFDDFGRMDIRTATVLEAERVPKTDKLLKLTIDTGIDRRVIVSGIAEYYSPEDMVGKQICILANLEPRVIRGIESKGMILMAKQGDGSMRFITPQEAVCNGAVIG